LTKKRSPPFRARKAAAYSIERRLSAGIATPELRRKVFDALADASRNVVSI